MSEAVDVIKREIAKRESEIAALRMALGALEGTPPLLQLPAPGTRKRRSKRDQPEEPESKGETGVYEVNGVDITLPPKQYEVLDRIASADDCLPVEELLPMFNGSRQYIQTNVWHINRALRAARAEIVRIKGAGYRLQNIQEGET